MAITRRLMRGVTPTQVFDVLRDGRSYGYWVVGTRTIRDVDPGWPGVGSRVHYTIGYRPLRKDDVTVSNEYEPDHRLALEAHAWPAGTAGVVLTVEPEDGGSRVSIDETPLQGLAKTLHSPLTEVLIKMRNVETLRRLESLARRR
jgi:hypothetical protein